jgi:hypothetical protein
LQHHWPDVPADLQEVIHKAIERDLDKRYATMAEFRDALVACSLWRGVTPEIAQGFLPRPSSFEGISDILPEEFVDEPGDRRAARRSSRPGAEARRAALSVSFDPRPVVFSAAPEAPRPATVERRAPRLSIDDERVATLPIPARAAAAATPSAPCTDAEIGTELSLSVAPPRAALLPGDVPRAYSGARRQRVEFDTLRASVWGRGRASRLVSGVSVALTLFCGAILAFGVMHWIQRPPAAVLTASLAAPTSALASPRAQRLEARAPEARAPEAEPELPRVVPEVRAPERDRPARRRRP